MGFDHADDGCVGSRFVGFGGSGAESGLQPGYEQSCQFLAQRRSREVAAVPIGDRLRYSFWPSVFQGSCC